MTFKSILRKEDNLLVVTEPATMKEPDSDEYTSHEKYVKDVAAHDVHLSTLRTFPAIGFSEEQVGMEVECVTKKMWSDGMVWYDASDEMYDSIKDESRRIIVAIPAPASATGDKRVNPVYNKRYVSEVVYHSDKNFIVRLKAMTERTLKHLGINVSSDKLNEFMDIIGDEAEDYLFENKSDDWLQPHTGDKGGEEAEGDFKLLEEYDMKGRLTNTIKHYLTKMPEENRQEFIVNLCNGMIGSAILHHNNRYVKKLNVPDFKTTFK